MRRGRPTPFHSRVGPRNLVLFGTALAMHFLGEKMNARRWMAALAIAAGAIMLQAA